MRVFASQVASVSLPDSPDPVPVTAACHYVPGSKNKPQYAPYPKDKLEAILARVTPAAS